MRSNNFHEVITWLDLSLYIHKKFFRCESAFQSQIERLCETCIIAAAIIDENFAGHFISPDLI